MITALKNVQNVLLRLRNGHSRVAQTQDHKNLVGLSNLLNLSEIMLHKHLHSQVHRWLLVHTATCSEVWRTDCVGVCDRGWLVYTVGYKLKM